MKTFKITIRTPDKEVLVADHIESVYTVTEGGPIKMYAHHSDLTGSILFSTLTVHLKDKEEKFMVRRGILNFDNPKNHATLLAISCEPLEHVRFETAKAYLDFIEEKIQSGEPLSGIKMEYLEKEKVAVTEQIEALKKNGEK